MPMFAELGMVGEAVYAEVQLVGRSVIGDI